MFFSKTKDGFKYGDIVIYQDPESRNENCTAKIINYDEKSGKYTLLMQQGVGGTRHQIHKSEISLLK